MFENTVADQCKAIGLGARASIRMTEFGADSSYGDLDTFAWDNRGTFLAIECKRLRAARTVAKIGEQLRAFTLTVVSICQRFRNPTLTSERPV